MPPGRRSVVASAPQKKTGSVGVRHEAAQEQSKNSLGERRIDLPALQADTDGESELGQEGLGPLELLESSPALAAKFVHEDPRLCDPCRETHFRPPTWSGGAFRRISRIAASPPQRRRDGTRKPAPSREMHPTSATQLSTVHGFPSSQTASLEHGGSVLVGPISPFAPASWTTVKSTPVPMFQSQATNSIGGRHCWLGTLQSPSPHVASVWLLHRRPRTGSRTPPTPARKDRRCRVTVPRADRGTLRAVETAGPRRGGGSSVTNAIVAASIAARVATSMLAASG